MTRIPLFLLPALVVATPALAHLEPGEHGSFAAGMTHPLFGADHVLAMVCVGLWAALMVLNLTRALTMARFYPEAEAAAR